MRILLSLETTGVHLGISLYSWEPQARRGSKISTYYAADAHRQSDLLIPTLDSQLKKSKLNKKDIAVIAVDIGPGSFTGVRVGVSVARALGQSLRVPVVGVSSLEAMAFAKFKNEKKKDVVVAALLRALEGETYVAVYSQDERGSILNSHLIPSWMSNKEVEPALKKIKLHGKKFSLVRTEEFPHPESVAEAAIQKLDAVKSNPEFGFEKVQPLYLQPSWAERKLLA